MGGAPRSGSGSNPFPTQTLFPSLYLSPSGWGGPTIIHPGPRHPATRQKKPRIALSSRVWAGPSPMAVWPLSKQDMLRLAEGHGSLGSQPSLGPPAAPPPPPNKHKYTHGMRGCGVTCQAQGSVSPTLAHSELT